MLDINKTHHGHVINLLKQLPDKSINCCVTSPPYWGLRDYGLEPQIWGGDENCEHEFYIKDEKREIRTGKGLAEWSEKNARGGGKKAGDVPVLEYKHGFCQKCNAWQGSYGLEPTPELYIEHTVLIFREIKRALTDHGTTWINLGDSYWGSGNASGHNDETKNLQAKTNEYGATKGHSQQKHSILKPKDLVGIPWMVAFALRADGWYLRSDIIWSKPNPMPESVTDRPTKAHEHIFLLSKNSKYFYDADAIKEDNMSSPSDMKKMHEQKDRIGGKTLTADDHIYAAHQNTNIGQKRGVGSGCGRNKRSVWEVTTKPFSEAHFATFPPDLIAPCIKAGCPEHVCTQCGKPREKVFEKSFTEHTGKTSSQYNKKTTAGRLAKLRQASRENGQEYVNEKKVIGYTDCGCNASPKRGTHQYQPGIVLDPFMGAGTTAMVAQKLNRNYIGIELNADYIKISDKRLYKELGMFNNSAQTLEVLETSKV